MQITTIFRLLGLLLMLFSLSMLTPIVVNYIFAETFVMPFLTAFLATFSMGFLLWICFRKKQKELKTRDGFLLVVLFWILLCSFASLPFVFAQHEKHSIINAIFESASAFTTTGATIITHLDDLPAAILFYRQQLEFLGGMGIIVLAVAILPMLGVGGMQLYQTETPGPMKDSKLTPRIAGTAKALWFTYLLITFACALCYKLAGMNWFNAIGESFATVSTGGFSMHDAGFAYYKSESLELIACFFMLLGGTNFALHFVAFQKRTLKPYWQDEEFRYYLVFLALGTLLVSISLMLYGFYKGHHTLVASLFNIISMATTTGFISEPFSSWPTFLPWLVLLLAVIGGCAASTSGGVKVMRALLVYKQGKREMERLIHPNAIIPIKFNNQVLAEPILQSMWGFISIFIALFLILTLTMLALHNDISTSLSAVIAALSNSGAGIGQISANFASLNDLSKCLLIFAMIAGRLEIFSLLILLSPRFWQR